MIESIYPFARRALFKLDAERAHHIGMNGLRVAENLNLLGFLLGQKHANQPIEAMGLAFPNRIGLAAGLDKSANCIDALGRMGFGAIEVGTFTPRPQPGNPQPRLFRLTDREAIINRMGFNNPGIEVAVEHARHSRTFNGMLGFNIGKNKDTPNEQAIDDYRIGLRVAYPVADYIVINLSSPNTPGLRDLQAADASAKMLEILKRDQAQLAETAGKYVPLCFKVAPDLGCEQIKDLAEVFLQGGLDGLITTNTTIDRTAISSHPLAVEAGGLSGRPLFEKSLETLSSFAEHLGGRIPLIGVGGIASVEDARLMLNAGASLLQIYTAFIYQGPRLVHELASFENAT